MNWDNRPTSFDDIEKQMRGLERHSRDEKIDTFCNKKRELSILIATFIGTKGINSTGKPYQLTPIITEMIRRIVKQGGALTHEQEEKISKRNKEATKQISILRKDLDKLVGELQSDYDEYINVTGPKTRWSVCKLLELKHAMEDYKKIQESGN